MALACALGCGYQSQYHPPDDARMRPVWMGRTIVPVGPSTLPACDGSSRAELPVETPLPQASPAWAFFPAAVLEREEEDDDDGGGLVAGAAVTAVIVAGLATTALALAFVPVGTTTRNAASIDAINTFNDELRRPDRCAVERGESQ